jgi:hypothetical protein
MTALIAGNSADIKIQLAAKGHHVPAIRFSVGASFISGSGYQNQSERTDSYLI